MYRIEKMCRTLLVMALLCLGLTGRPAAATEVLGASLLATGGALSVTVKQADSGYESKLYLKNPDPSQPDIYLASSRQTGRFVSMPTYPAGTPLVFYITVNETGKTYYMGDGYANPDRIPHAKVKVSEPYYDYTLPGWKDMLQGQALVGFEDLFNGGDQDYNDNVFLFQGVNSVWIDSTPPTIGECSVTPGVIWPPNHQMVDVTVNYTLSDDQDVTAVLSITSNEPDNGLGDGDKANDFEIIDAHHVRVRAERSGKGAGRVYTITITATDSSGNISTHTCLVTVPHDMRP